MSRAAGRLRAGRVRGAPAARGDRLPSLAPEFEVAVEKNVMVRMRDGRGSRRTSTGRRRGRVPRVLIRTPYGKDMSELKARFYARRGYVFAVQDCRGRFASEGSWNPFSTSRGTDTTRSSGSPSSHGPTARWNDRRLVPGVGAVVGRRRKLPRISRPSFRTSRPRSVFQHAVRVRLLLPPRRDLVGRRPRAGGDGGLSGRR